MGVNLRTVGPVAVIVVAGAAADLATKAWAQSRLSAGRDITLGGGLLRLQLRINHGAAFGLGAVVDWLHVSFYGPTFNLADVLLRGGLVLAAVGWLFSRRTATRVTTGDSWSGRPTQ